MAETGYLEFLMAESTKINLTRIIFITIVKLGDNFIVAGQQNLTIFKQHVKYLTSTIDSTGSLFPMSGAKYAAANCMRVNKTNYFSNEHESILQMLCNLLCPLLLLENK